MIKEYKKTLDAYVIENVLLGNSLPFAVGDAVIISSIGTGVFTVTSANPAVFTQVSHGLVAGNTVQFGVTGGALALGLSPNTIYYVLASGLTANDFEVSLTPGGAVVATTSTGSGTQYLTGSNSVIGAAGTTGIIFGTILKINAGQTNGNIFLQTDNITTKASNTMVEKVTCAVMATDLQGEMIADLDAPAGTTPNSEFYGYFNLSATLNGTLDETSYSLTEKQFLSYGLLSGSTTKVVGVWTKIAKA